MRANEKLEKQVICLKVKHMHATTMSTRKNVAVSFKQNENRDIMLVTNLSSVISNKMRTEKPCLLLICLQLFNLQGSYDFDILAKEQSYVFAKFACCIYRNDLAFYFQDMCENLVQMNGELKKEVLSFKVHSCS